MGFAEYAGLTYLAINIALIALRMWDGRSRMAPRRYGYHR